MGVPACRIPKAIFSAEVSQARALVDVDPGKYAESLRQLQEKISTLHQRAKVILYSLTVRRDA